MPWLTMVELLLLLPLRKGERMGLLCMRLLLLLAADLDLDMLSLTEEALAPPRLGEL